MRERLFQELQARAQITPQQWQLACSLADDIQGSVATHLALQGADPELVLDAFCAVSGLPPAPPDRVRQPSCPQLQGFDPIVCWRVLALPFALERGRLHVAFADPEVAEQASILGLPFHTPYLALEEDLLKGLEQLFGPQPAPDTAYVPRLKNPSTTIFQSNAATEKVDPALLELGHQLRGAARKHGRGDPKRPPSYQAPPTAAIPGFAELVKDDERATGVPNRVRAVFNDSESGSGEATFPGAAADPAPREDAFLEPTIDDGRSARDGFADAPDSLVNTAEMVKGELASALPHASLPDSLLPEQETESTPHATAPPRGDDDKRARRESPVVQGRGVARPLELAPGSEFAGFEIQRKLGEGGMAHVYLAHALGTGQPVALKVMLPHLASDQVFLDRFQREIEACIRLKHPHIVGVYAQGEEDGAPYMVAELLGRGTVGELLKAARRLPARLVAAIADDVLAGLAYAHERGIVHRDIKPANLLIDDVGRVKIGDFGIAKHTGDATLTRTGFLVGTPAYVSPEQALGQPIDGRSDLFSVGVVLYQLLTGTNPFLHENPSVSLLRISEASAPPIYEVEPTLPGALERVVVGLLRPHPDQRFPDAATARALLAPLLADDPHGLVLSAVESPGSTRDRLVVEQAAAERERARALLAEQPPRFSTAALALYRASLLKPGDSLIDADLAKLCREHQLQFTEPTDARWAETLSTLTHDKASPGLLKRASDLARAHGNLHLCAVYLRRYLDLRPQDTHARGQLTHLLGDDTGPTGPFGASAAQSAVHAGPETQALVEGIKTGGMKQTFGLGAAPTAPAAPTPAPGSSGPRVPLPEAPRAPLAMVAQAEGSASPLEWVQGVWRAIGVKALMVIVVVGGAVFGVRAVGTLISSSQVVVDDGIAQLKGEAPPRAQQRQLDILAKAEQRLQVRDFRQARGLADSVIQTGVQGPLKHRALLLRARAYLGLRDVASARLDLEEVQAMAGPRTDVGAEASALLDKL